MGTFNFTNNLDQDLFARFAQEAIQLYGIDVEYWNVTFDTTKDKIYAEDSKPKVTAVFKLRAYAEIIQEDFILTRFGLGSNDIYSINLDVKEWDESVGSSTPPKPGDYFWIKYMNRLFIVTDIDKENNVFLQKKFVYNIHLKAADISGEEIGANLGITNYEAVADVQNDNTAITAQTSGFVIQKTGDTSIFGAFE